jgi:hypothetical protein
LPGIPGIFSVHYSHPLPGLDLRHVWCTGPRPRQGQAPLASRSLPDPSPLASRSPSDPPSSGRPLAALRMASRPRGGRFGLLSPVRSVATPSRPSGWISPYTRTHTRVGASVASHLTPYPSPLPVELQYSQWSSGVGQRPGMGGGGPAGGLHGPYGPGPDGTLGSWTCVQVASYRFGDTAKTLGGYRENLEVCLVIQRKLSRFGDTAKKPGRKAGVVWTGHLLYDRHTFRREVVGWGYCRTGRRWRRRRGRRSGV